MLGETLNATMTNSVGTSRVLPKSLLYSIFARIGGHGLDTDSFEALRASYRGKFLGKAVAYDNRQRKIPSLIEIPTWHRGSQPAEISGQKSEVRPKSWKSRFLLERERFLEEYELASLVVVLSEKAAESFRVAGFPDEKLFY